MLIVRKLHLPTSFQTLIIEMKRLEDELNYLEERGKGLEQDSEMLNLQATVSGLSTRLRTVLAQALAKRTEIEVKSKLSDFEQYFMRCGRGVFSCV